MALKNAQIVAVSVEVHCPRCGEPQPKPDDGAHTWLPYEVQRAQMNGDGRRECVSCEEPFRIVYQSSAAVLP